ncbi:MAG: hypothetical protein D3907_14795 [Candidatus Electrothrix sp. AUS3]|nr:hypothetical protein [Candidatus Electrothrix gigas]
MIINIWNFLTHHAKWVLSGIGTVFIGFILTSTCSNGAEDKSPIVINNPETISGDITSGIKIGGDQVGTIHYGDEFNGDKVLVLGDKVSGDKVTAETIHYGDKVSGDNISVSGDNNVVGDKVSGDKVLGDKYTTYNSSPSFREVTVARGENRNPIGIADNPSPIQNAVGLLAKVMRGEEVNLQEASPSKFLINSGTEIAILDSDNSSEQPSTGFTDPIGFTQFVNIKILEGPYKNRTGWIHASTIHHEQRKK